MSDLISVIVPVYNVEEYLRECIDSIIEQTYSNLEIILIDDGSKDESGIICDEYEKKDSRIKVIHKENAGVSSARNTGLQIATGDWVAFVDSDDWLEENYFEVLMKCAIDKKAEIVSCGYNRVTVNKKESINNSGNILIFDARNFLIKLLNPQVGYGFTHMKIYKREIINDVVFDTELKVGEDCLFNEQVVLNANRICVIEKNLYNYRVNPNSVVRSFDKNYVNKYLKAMNKNKEYLKKHYENDTIIKQSYYNYVAFHVMLIAVNYCYNLENTEKNKRKLLKEICCVKCFEEGIKNSNYQNLSLTRQITLFTLKHKLYFFTEFICKYRQRQGKVRSHMKN